MIEKLRKQVMEESLLNNTERTAILKVSDYCKHFSLITLFDWVVCLHDPSLKQENSEVFWDNVAQHLLKGVIVLSPIDSSQVHEQLVARQFEVDYVLQAKLRKHAQATKYNRLTVLRSKKPKTFLLTAPKSGTNWMAYSLMQLTKQPFMYISPQIRNVRILQCTNIKDDAFICAHLPSIVLNQNQNTVSDKLIVLVRNYFEELISLWGDYKQTFKSAMSTSKHNYFDILNLYDAWNPNQRILVYYEDLMTDYEGEMKRVLDFLGSEAGLQDFLDHYERYREESMQRYTFGIQSGGADLLYHSRNVPLVWLVQLENFFKKKYPYLWNKYLTRYAVKDRNV